MKKTKWQVQSPIHAIIFDCDGTLSAIEGMDELAKKNGVSEAVQPLTAQAMGKTGLTPEVYKKRIDLIIPNKEQVLALGQHYYLHVIPDAQEVLKILKRLNKTIYLVSSGLYPAVKIFGELLNIPKENIFAVDIYFDNNGHLVDFERNSPLIDNNGKRTIVQQIKSFHPNIIYVGDGLNDYCTYDLVTRFVGYGGVYYRENIESRCQYYIRTLSMGPLLPLSLTEDECAQLTPEEQQLYQKGLAAIQEGKVKI